MPTHFEDIPLPERCTNAEHNPPSHVVIPPGKKMVHTCPACGKRTEVTPTQVTW